MEKLFRKYAQYFYGLLAVGSAITSANILTSLFTDPAYSGMSLALVSCFLMTFTTLSTSIACIYYDRKQKFTECRIALEILRWCGVAMCAVLFLIDFAAYYAMDIITYYLMIVGASWIFLSHRIASIRFLEEQARKHIKNDIGQKKG